MKHLFRTSDRSMLAMDPRALSIEFETSDPPENTTDDGVAFVYINGPLEHHHSYLFDSYDCILERLEEAFADTDVQKVVMCIDSPGGDAAGSVEAHKQIQRLKRKYKKKLYAYSNEAMFSAAYAIGSAADEIWVPETGGVGSVGVICTVLDKTKQNEQQGLNIQLITTGERKADTHADRELTQDVIDSIQKRVDYLGNVFFRCVAKARNMTPKDVQRLEAGVFMGSEAVSSKLADRVSGWYGFLEHVKSDTADGNFARSAKGASKMKTLAQLKKAQALAAKKIVAAKTDSERIKCMSAYELASKELAEFEAKAKTRFVKKTEERYTQEDEEEEESEEEEEEDSEEEDSEEEESDDDGDDDDDDDDDEDEDEEDEEEDEEKSKKMKASSLSLKAVSRLYDLASKATGKKNIREIFGALDGMSARLSRSTQVEKRLEKIEKRDRKADVKAMLDKAQKDGRVTPAQARGLLDQGMKDPKWLKGYLSSQPKIMRDLDVPDTDALPSSVETMSLSRDQEKMIQQAAASAGIPVEEYREQMKKYSKKINGTPTRV